MFATMARRPDRVQQELVSVRDTVQGIWVAIVLAFVLRAFLFEAFVIPTGSMAPRLLGEHWDITCPKCGYQYAHGLQNSAEIPIRYTRRSKFHPHDARCPNCRYRQAEMSYINGGDRVLVLKYLYPFREPKPWEVVVFKNPQNNRENYIKRLIGLPGETIEIVHGDIFVKSSPLEPWRIRRKPPRAQEAMWQVIYDNDYLPEAAWAARSRSPRWVRGAGGEAWDLTVASGRRFAFSGSDEPAFIELAARWESFLPRYGYNRPGDEIKNVEPAIDVCGDLKLSVVLVPQAADTTLSLLLSSFEHLFKAQVGVDGSVELLYRDTSASEEGWQLWDSSRIAPLELDRGCEVVLVHADARVTLWIDGKMVLQSTDEQFPGDYEWVKRRIAKVRRRAIPIPRVGIAAQGGPAQLRHIAVMRDVYYTSPDLRFIRPDVTGDYARSLGVAPHQPGWATTGHPLVLAKDPDNPELDEFFVLGDNSPQSHDGRTWTEAAPTLQLRDAQGEAVYQLGTVPRYNLIGKAFCVYWPSGYRPPGLAGLPIIPNVGRMRLIR